MRKQMKNATKVGLLSGLAVLTLTTLSTGVLGQTNELNAVNAGDNVDIDSSSSQNTTVRIVNDNTATVNQTVNASANTGGNVAQRNLGGASITTGAALTGAALHSNTNQNLTAVSGMGSVGGSNTTNVANVGDDVTVDTSSNTRTNVDVINRNDARITQDATMRSNTGRNTAERNLGGQTSINTGAATAVAEFGAMANRNQNYLALGSGSGSSMNETNITNAGDNVDIDSRVRSNTNVRVVNDNTAVFNQSLDARTNSGNNSALRNLGGASIRTGAASIGGDMSADANANLTAISGNLFNAAMSNSPAIVNVGDDFTVDSSTTATTDVVVRNVGMATVDQDVESRSNSGRNLAERNLGMAMIASGASALGMELGASGNTNFTVFGSDWADCLGWWTCNE